MPIGPKGVIRNAFYKRNTCGDTRNTFWGRVQGSNIEVFDYRENEKGRIVIIEKHP